MNSGLVQSVQTRLARHANGLGLDPNLVLARYAIERLLYRLSRSAHGERFVLKGGLLMLVWLGETIRPTRDADLLGFGSLDGDTLRQLVTEVCATPVEPDGLSFDTDTIRVEPIRAEDAYGGQRVRLQARLGAARIRAQLDIGVGDAVVPEPQWIEYPSLLDLSRARLRAYRSETTIAEKLHAMVVLDARNSRMRDFFDVHALAARKAFDGATLLGAVLATFGRRGTPLPVDSPLALTPEFAEVEGKELQWKGFVRRLPGTTEPLELRGVLEGIAAFAAPVLLAAARGDTFDGTWPPGGPWAPSEGHSR